MPPLFYFPTSDQKRDATKASVRLRGDTATPADGAFRAAFRLTVRHRAAWLNRSWLTGARRIYFWSDLCLKSRLFRPQREDPRLWPGRGQDLTTP